MALRGASNVLSRCPMVMLEYSPAYMRASSVEPNDLIELMSGLGFSANILKNGKLTSVNSKGLKSVSNQVDLFWVKH